MSGVVVRGAFDNLRAMDVRFLEEASKMGPLTVWLDSDAASKGRTGQGPMFALEMQGAAGG